MCEYIRARSARHSRAFVSSIESSILNLSDMLLLTCSFYLTKLDTFSEGYRRKRQCRTSHAIIIIMSCLVLPLCEIISKDWTKCGSTQPHPLFSRRAFLPVSRIGAFRTKPSLLWVSSKGSHSSGQKYSDITTLTFNLQTKTLSSAEYLSGAKSQESQRKGGSCGDSTPPCQQYRWRPEAWCLQEAAVLALQLPCMHHATGHHLYRRQGGAESPHISLFR